MKEGKEREEKGKQVKENVERRQVGWGKGGGRSREKGEGGRYEIERKKRQKNEIKKMGR